MRIIVALQPTNRRGTKSEYTAFRKLLASKGFVLVQPEVFLASAPTRRAAGHLLESLKGRAPSTGNVFALVLTKRQFLAIECIAGGPSVSGTGGRIEAQRKPLGVWVAHATIGVSLTVASLAGSYRDAR